MVFFDWTLALKIILILGVADSSCLMAAYDNILAGGAGNDQFWIATAEVPNGINTVKDFSSGEDVLGIGGFPELTFDDITRTQDGENTIIGLDKNTPLAELQGVQASSLTSQDFTFAAESPV